MTQKQLDELMGWLNAKRIYWNNIANSGGDSETVYTSWDIEVTRISVYDEVVDYINQIVGCGCGDCCGCSCGILDETH